MKAPATKPPVTVDDYLTRLAPQVRDTLQKVRLAIRAAAPKAEECISYQVPTFKYKGTLVSYAAFTNHCSFFGGHGIIKIFSKELEPFDVKGSTIRFPQDKPLPAALVKKMVKQRVKENEARAAAKK
jgi:uncharacterized protein YdhG (YjbR/CyaY superfamily)